MLVVKGPTIAGIGPGSVLAIESPARIPILRRPDRFAVAFLIDLNVPGRRILRRVSRRGRLLRPMFLDVAEEFCFDGTTRRGGDRLEAGPWTIELLSDTGAAIATRRVGDLLVGRPLGLLWVDSENDPELFEPAPVWLDIADPQTWVVFTTPAPIRVPRLRGPHLDLTRRTTGAIVDHSRAKAIAQAADSRGPNLSLSYDGVPFCDGKGGAFTALEHFARLIGRPLIWDRERSELQRTFDDTTAASIEDLAAFARALDPIGWEREQQLRDVDGTSDPSRNDVLHRASA